MVKSLLVFCYIYNRPDYNPGGSFVDYLRLMTKMYICSSFHLWFSVSYRFQISVKLDIVLVTEPQSLDTLYNSLPLGFGLHKGSKRGKIKITQEQVTEILFTSTHLKNSEERFNS